MSEETWCPTCQSNGCMTIGASAPRTFDMDMMGQIGWTCRYCGTRGWGPRGLVCTYEPGPIGVTLDGDMWCATETATFTNLQESPAGFGRTRLEAVKELTAALRAVGGEGGRKDG